MNAPLSQMTLDEAIAAWKPEDLVKRERHFAYFRSDVNGEKGVWRPNLVTNAGNDWLSYAMGMGPSSAFASAQGAATATGATSLTNSGATFPTSGNGLAGQIVVAGPNSSGTGSKVYGIIKSNTSTVLTVDQWYDPTSTSGAAGTTPNATASYVILPGNASASWMAITSDSAAPAAGDTTLASELATNGFSRAVGTWAHTNGTTTYTLTHTWTCSGGSTTINKEAQFQGASGTFMPFESAEPSPPTLVSGDTLQNTITITV